MHSGETVLQFHAASGFVPIRPDHLSPWPSLSHLAKLIALAVSFCIWVNPTSSAVGWKTNGKLLLAWLLVAAIKRFSCCFSCFSWFLFRYSFIYPILWRAHVLGSASRTSLLATILFLFYTSPGYTQIFCSCLHLVTVSFNFKGHLSFWETFRLTLFRQVAMSLWREWERHIIPSLQPMPRTWSVLPFFCCCLLYIYVLARRSCGCFRRYGVPNSQKAEFYALF